jgi:hypothetical protein
VEKLKQSESAETVLANPFARCGVKDIDEHVFFRVTGEKTGENFDEVFLLV